MVNYNEIDNPYIIEVFSIFSRKYLEYDVITVSVSGGADSDIVLDIAAKIDKDKKINYVFADTGLEYQVTKSHIEFLQKKYNVEIKTEKPAIPIPLANRKYGNPFLSKYISEMIERLQRHNFRWENEDFTTLYKRYPKCKAALRWWCNDFGENSRFNISHRKGLKEFMIAHPPKFRISPKCCQYAKKDVTKKFNKNIGCELNCTGIRKNEGGVRATAYNSCFNISDKQPWHNYRPIFWFDSDTKKEYENLYGVQHSECYEKYGLKRTGCAGCPFGQNFERELEVIKQYEPKLYKAVNKVFKDSYEYTRLYKEWVSEQEKNNRR